MFQELASFAKDHDGILESLLSDLRKIAPDEYSDEMLKAALFTKIIGDIDGLFPSDDWLKDYEDSIQPDGAPF